MKRQEKRRENRRFNRRFNRRMSRRPVDACIVSKIEKNEKEKPITSGIIKKR